MTQTTRRIAAAAMTLLVTSFPAFAEPGIGTGDSSIGKVLTDAQGMTLYTFDKDKDGKSACYDDCAKNWPPLLAGAGDYAEDGYGLTDRTDGAKQWTAKGMPLYTWIKDVVPGDVSGDGVNSVWHAAKP